MTNLILHRNETPGNAIALPEPRHGRVEIRVATLRDLPFIDALQKKHSKMVGFLKRAAIETRLKLGDVLIAEQGNVRVGYSIAQDRYFRRDECGLITQVNIVPTCQRGLIGAMLVKEIFNRASYACKLFCCWCAQDLEANRFWESLGFVPLGFRTGSRRTRRMDGTMGPRTQIFWQRRIREGDDMTPYWMPTETSNGAIQENRIALPIPPGMHWSDPMPVVVPGMEKSSAATALRAGETNASGGAHDDAVKAKRVKSKAPATPALRSTSIRMGGLRFVPGKPPEPVKPEKQKKAKEKAVREKFENDPELVSKARVLISKYLDQVNVDPGMLLPPSAHGKYEVSRQLEAAPSLIPGAMKIEQLPAAPNVGGLLEAA